MSRQLNYIIYAFLLLAVVAGLFQFIKRIPGGNSQQEQKPIVVDYVDQDIPKSSPTVALGKAIFLSKCASCHIIFRDATGPNLAEAFDNEQWSDRKKLYDWIKNPADFMKKDSYARSLKEKFGTMMTAFPDIQNEEIDAIVEYIRHETQVRSRPMPVAMR